jgi:hypothetical protein
MPHAAVCDSVFISFVRHLNDAKGIDSHRPGMKDRFKELVGDEKYAEWATKATTNDEVVPNRIKAADKALFVSSAKK